MTIQKCSPIICLLISLIFFSCSDVTPDEIEMEEMEQEEDCFYKFPDNLDDIFGAWEPKQIINLTTNDTTIFEEGKGHTGFFLDSFFYGDSFELRDNNEIDLYYAVNGRPCLNDNVLSWMVNDNQIIIPYSELDTFTLPIISISAEELVIEDNINFNPSIAIMRKTN